MFTTNRQLKLFCTVDRAREDDDDYIFLARHMRRPKLLAILAPNIPSSTVQLPAATADRIIEYYQPPITVNVASHITAAVTIENVMERLDDLEVSQFRASRAFRRRSPSIARRHRSPTAESASSTQGGF
ncbi:hypothetical protein SprV_0200870800 [Sparganum proliferum]